MRLYALRGRYAPKTCEECLALTSYALKLLKGGTLTMREQMNVERMGWTWRFVPQEQEVVDWVRGVVIALHSRGETHGKEAT